MLELGLQYREQFVSVTALAEKRSIPGPFLEKLLLQLKHAGLTKSRRGPDGGYTLALAPEKIRIGDIFTAVEGPINFTSGFEAQESYELVTFFAEVEENVRETLNSKTLYELCNHARKYKKSTQPKHPFFI